MRRASGLSLKVLLPILLVLGVIGLAVMLVLAPDVAPDLGDDTSTVEVDTAETDDAESGASGPGQPEVPEGATALTVSGKRAAKLRGLVRLYHDRSPVSGLTFTIADDDGASLQVTTGSDGTFRFDRLPYQVPLTLTAEREPYASLRLSGILLEPKEEHDVGTLWLAEEVELDVLVLSQRGEPLAGAEVSAFASGRAAEVTGDGEQTQTAWMLRDVAPTATASTDEAGRATLTGLMPGSYAVRAEAEGLARASRAGIQLAPDAGDREIRLLLGAGHPLEGTVFGPDGEPAPDIQVAIGGTRAKDAWQAVSGPDGRFRFDGLPTKPLSIYASRDGSTVESYGSIALPGTRRFDIHLRRTTSVIGTVTDEDGEPVAEANVRVMVQGMGTQALATTDAEGRYEVAPVPAAALSSVNVSADGYVRHPDPAAPNANLGVILRDDEPFELDITLRKGLSAEVTVLGGDGERLSGVNVSLLLVSRWNQGQSFQASTGDGGVADIGGLVTGTYLVHVQAPGHVQPDLPPRHGNLLQSPDSIPAKYRLTLDPESSPGRLEVRLSAGTSVAGTVLDPDDQPVVGAEITIAGARPEKTVFSDETGAWRLDGVPPSRRSVASARVPDGPSGTSEPFLVNEGEAVEDIEIRVAPTASITGTVGTADGSSPDYVFVRWVSGSVRGGGNWVSQRFDAAEAWPVAADGTFRITGVPVRGEEATVTVRADADGYLPGSDPEVVVRPDQETGGVQLRLGKATELTGRVEDPAGNPVPGATVRHRFQGDGSSSNDPGLNRRRRRQGAATGAGGTPVAQTDADGRFVLRGIPPGNFRLWAEAPGFASSDNVEASPGGGDAVIQLRPGLTISGVVRDESNQPLAGVPVQPRRTDRGGSNRWWRGSSQVFTDAEGRFELRDLIDGTYDLTVSARWAWGREINVEDKVEQGISAGRDDVVITVKAGRAIEGRVKDSEGEAVPGGWVQARPSGGGGGGWNSMRWGQIRPDGTFRITGLVAGTFDVIASGSFRQTTREGVAAGATDVELEVEPGFSISGYVVDGDGFALQQFGVRTRRTGSEDWGWSQVVQPGDGEFILTDMAEGSWDLQFTSNGYAPTAVTNITAGRDGVEVVLSRGHELTGSVVDANGSPVPRAWVQASQTDAAQGMPASSANARTDDQGEFKLVGLAKGTYRLSSQANGFARYSADGVRSGSTGTRIVLEVGVEITGIAKNESGEPMPSSQLQLAGADGQVLSWARTNDEGRFTFNNVPSGLSWRVRMRYFANGQMQWLEHDGDVQSGATDVELTFK